MKKQRWFYFLNLLTLFLLSLAGCGGDESYISTSSTTATVPFRGVVEDGPIAGAKISLRDKDENYYPLYNSLGHDEYLISTDENGVFSRNVKAGTDFSKLTVHAVGGIDRDTGMDFSGLEMRSLLGLFNGDVSTIVVSPLTTLVAELHDQGFSLPAAEILLEDWLFPNSDVDLAASPSTNFDLQRCTLLLSKLALESTKEKPFALIGKQIFLAETLVDVSVMEELGIVDTDTQNQITKLQAVLASAATVEEMFTVYKREELRNIFEVNFKEILELSTSFDAQQNLNYQKNVKILVEKTLLAAGSEVIPLVEPIPSRLFHYVFFSYFLDKQKDLDLEKDPFKRSEMIKTLTSDWLTSTDFTASLSFIENDGSVVALEYDPWIVLLARSRAANSVDSPLLLNELPGNNNQSRVAYFYGSDVSPHYRAEQLIGNVYDDFISDEILVQIVGGKANAGLIDEAWVLIDTQIFQSEAKANAYRALANILIKYEKVAEAKKALISAWNLYYTVIDSHLKASAVDDEDILNLYNTADSMGKAGYLEGAEKVLTYLSEVKAKLTDNSQALSLISAGFKKIAMQYIATGDYQAAAPLVDLSYEYAQIIPANLDAKKNPVSYLTRVILLSNTAMLYADINNREKVLQIYEQIQYLRLTDEFKNKTGALTWNQIPDLIESLFRVGELDYALSLANSIPLTQPKIKAKALKLITTIVALSENFDSAYAMVANEVNFPTPEDRVDALTYNGLNMGRAYIGLALIKAGRPDEARQALQKAEELLEGMAGSNNMNRIVYGYVKVAGLYNLLGDTTKSLSLLQRGIDVIADDEYRVVALADIALAYHRLNQTEIALTLLDDALKWMAADPTRYRDLAYFSSTKPLDIPPAATTASVYEVLVTAYAEIGVTVKVKTTTDLYLSWAQTIHPTDIVDDNLANKECYYLLRGALYLDKAGYHTEALQALHSAEEVFKQITVAYKDRLLAQIDLITTYAKVHKNETALDKALAIKKTDERNQALQALAEMYIDRDDFPQSLVASIDTDRDGKPDFFNPLSSAEEIAASGLIMDDDSDGDGIIDTLDIRPLFKD